jgi:hypothetical protein
MDFAVKGSGLMAIPYLACMALVASIYHLPPRALPAIHAVEGGKPGTIHHNKNGTDDLGVMQVNTRWLPALSAYTGLPPEVVRARLIEQPCFNIAAAGAILKSYLVEAHNELLPAIGYYHSHSPLLHDRYRALVTKAAAGLFGNSASSGPQ